MSKCTKYVCDVVQAAKTLLAYSADVIKTDEKSCSPLRHAVKQGDADMVNHLICRAMDSTFDWSIPLVCVVKEVRLLLYLHIRQHTTSQRLT